MGIFATVLGAVLLAQADSSNAKQIAIAGALLGGGIAASLRKES